MQCLPGDHLHDVLERLAELQAAAAVGDVLRAAIACGCAATASPRGTAGLYDGQMVTADAWYDRERDSAPAHTRWELGKGVPERVCASGTPFLSDEPAEAGSPLEPADVRGFTRFACVPLLGAHGEAIGFLEIGDRAEPYSAPHVRHLQDIARLAAHRLEDVSGMRRRRAEAQTQADIAERLQRRLLPPELPPLRRLDIASRYRSASAGVLSGGDFVDCYTRPPSDTLAFAIGDVSGKGVEAMAHAFVTKFILRGAVHGGLLSWPTHPGGALQELRTGLLEQPDFDDESCRFVTVLFGLLSPSRGLLQLASAGHPSPFIVRATGVERPPLPTESAIGVEPGAALAPYPTENIHLEPGDLVVVFTDGLTELRDGAGAFFEERMPDVLAACHDAPAAAVIDRLIAAGEAFSARPSNDDLALLCIRLLPSGHQAGH